MNMREYDKRLFLEQFSEIETSIKNFLFETIQYLDQSPYKLESYTFKDNTQIISTGDNGLEISSEEMIAMNIEPIIATYSEILKKFYCAKSAHKIFEETNDDWSLYWKYKVRNFYMRNIISDLFSIIDYIAFYINELSNHSFETNPKKVNFTIIKTKINRYTTGDRGYLNEEDMNILKTVFNNLGEAFNKPNKDLRNISIHRYYLSIDELPVTGYIEDNTRFFSSKNNLGQFKYEDIYKISEQLIKATSAGLKEILNISSVKKILV